MEAVREWLRQARSVAVLTGAGVSAESGIPTFRDNNGLWRQFHFEDLATPEAFARDPRLVWEWYDWRRGLIAQAQPNAGHRALAAIEARVPDFTLITQNLDDLHERAGSRNVLHVHGSIWTMRCIECGFEQVDQRVPLPELPPLHQCSPRSLFRPGVVWFGESLAPNVWEAAESAVHQADLLLVIGTSAVVYPSAGLARIAKSAGARVVEINLAGTPLASIIDEFLQGASGEVLPSLIA